MNEFQIHYPCNPYRLNQPFGENQACVEDKPLLPLFQKKIIGKVTGGFCPAGFVELYPLLGLKGHPGEDLYAPDGWLIRAPHNGIVKEVQLEPERGLGIGIITENQMDIGILGFHYVKTRQWHLKKIFVSLGQKVNVGDVIGLADNTGLSAGSHNHFEVKPVEYDSKGYHYNVYQDNGYYGSINPAPFWSGLYAEEYSSISAQLNALRLKLAEIVKKIFNLFKK